MTIWAIGDIQGCYDEFMQLLDKVDYQPDEDKLWLLGDLINRGPRNCEVLDFVIQEHETHGNITCVLGNHDLHFMAAARGKGKVGKSDTLSDLLENAKRDTYVEFLRNQPLLQHDTATNTVIVHAGLPPQLSLTECLALSAEVERVLQSEQLDEFLSAMYGNEPDRWHPSLTGMERLRVITNGFTRIRYCTAKGKLELTHKSDIQPEGYAPWFSFKRIDDDQQELPTIIFGHWAALCGETGFDRYIALDTGCVWGREMTALAVASGNQERRFARVPAVTKPAVGGNN